MEKLLVQRVAYHFKVVGNTEIDGLYLDNI